MTLTAKLSPKAPKLLTLVFSSSFALGSVGCASTPSAGPAPSSTTKAEPAPAPAKKVAEKPAPTPAPAAKSASALVAPGPILFAYDSSELTADGRASLDRLANDLMARTSQGTVAVTVEGHADERGSDAYNLSLGQQRADAIAKYLRAKGVSESRLKSVSYGEHRPAVAGSGEGAWTQNRRGELRVDAPKGADSAS